MAGELNRRIKKQGKFMAVDFTVGACTVNCTYGDQIRKIREEISEINNALVHYGNTVDNGKEVASIGAKWDILEESCDAITSIFTLINMLGFDSWNVSEMMEEVRKKNMKRGYLS